MPITKPFTVTTTIVTTVDPARPMDEVMSHSVTIDVPENVEMPENLYYGVAQAACEHVMESLMEKGIGIEGEVVEEDTSRCNVGNLRRIHTGPCDAYCDVPGVADDFIDVDCVEVAE